MSTAGEVFKLDVYIANIVLASYAQKSRFENHVIGIWRIKSIKA